MYLLIPVVIGDVPSTNTFTFHNVSINSFMQGNISEDEFDLHSIMYLLIRRSHEGIRTKIAIYIP